MRFWRWLLAAVLVAAIVYLVCRWSVPRIIDVTDAFSDADLSAKDSMSSVISMVVAVVSLVVTTFLGVLQLRQPRPAAEPLTPADPLAKYLAADGRLPTVGGAGGARMRRSIHPAIAAGPGAAPTDALPVFVERDRGPELLEWFRSARGTGGFLVLIGDSAVGKSRLLYEIARTVLPDFAVLVPEPGDGAAVNALADAVPVATLVWLDEIQRFLDGPHLTMRSSAIGPDAVGRLLDADAAVVIVGTLWPEYATELRGSSPAYPGATDILDDPRLHEIRLSTFSPSEQERAVALAAQDGRLAEAANDRDFNVTEMLAGAREIVRRYESGTAEHRALVEAAVDARRFGVESPLPPEMLRAVACGYLSGARPDPAWFTATLAEVVRPRRGAAAIRETAGGYVAADYLYQRLSRQRRTTRVSEASWRALVTGVTDRHDLERLARAAGNRLLLVVAEGAHQRLAALGSWPSTEWLITLLTGQGRDAEVLDLLRAAADAGGHAATRQYAERLRSAGRVEELRGRAHRGDREAERVLVDALLDANRAEEAIAVLEVRAARGDGAAEHRLIELLVRHGRAVEAVPLIKRVSRLDLRAEAEFYFRQEPRVVELVATLVEAGRLDDAVAVLDFASGRVERVRELPGPQPEHLVRLIALLVGDRRTDEALRVWLGDLTRSGRTTRPSPSDELALELLQRGDIPGALEVLRAGTSGMVDNRSGLLVELLAEHGLTDVLEARAKAGDPSARRALTDVAARRRDLGQLRAMADRMDTYASRLLTDLLLENGDIDEAFAVLRKFTEAGDARSASRLADLLVERGEVEQAIEILRERAGKGDSGAATRLSELLQQAGRDGLSEAVDVVQGGRGGSGADRAIIKQMIGQGRLDDVLSLLARHPQIDPAAPLTALVDAGRLDDAMVLLATRNDRRGLRQQIQLLRVAAAAAERADLLGALAEMGDARANQLLVRLLMRRDDTDALAVRAAGGDWVAVWGMATWLSERGRVDDAVVLLRPHSDAGDQQASRQLVEILVEAGRIDEAAEVLRSIARRFSPLARQFAQHNVTALVERGELDVAERLLRLNAETELRWAAEQLNDFLSRQGRLEELRDRSDAGDSDAAARLSAHLTAEDRVDDLRAEVDAGLPGAADKLVAYLATHGQQEQARLLRTYGLTVAGAPAEPPRP